MTLIVILNAALAVGIVGAIVALHARAIVADHRGNHGSASLWAWRPEHSQPVDAVPEYGSRSTSRTRAPQRRKPALVTD